MEAKAAHEVSPERYARMKQQRVMSSIEQRRLVSVCLSPVAAPLSLTLLSARHWVGVVRVVVGIFLQCTELTACTVQLFE